MEVREEEEAVRPIERGIIIGRKRTRVKRKRRGNVRWRGISVNMNETRRGRGKESGRGLLVIVSENEIGRGIVEGNIRIGNERGIKRFEVSSSSNIISSKDLDSISTVTDLLLSTRTGTLKCRITDRRLETPST